jgi:hypothetical protein
VLVVNNFNDVAGRVAKFMRLMLISDQPGEVIAARSALQRTLESAGYDFHRFVDLIESGQIVDADTMRQLQEAQDALERERAQAQADIARASQVLNSERATLYSMADYCDQRGAFRSETERTFVSDMVVRSKYGTMTDKQEKWLRDIFVRSKIANGERV